MRVGGWREVAGSMLACVEQLGGAHGRLGSACNMSTSGPIDSTGICITPTGRSRTSCVGLGIRGQDWGLGTRMGMDVFLGKE